MAGIILLAAANPTVRPTSVLPVKASLLNLGWSKINWPLWDPLPVITLKTPLGKMSLIILANSKTDKEVSEEG